MTKEAARQDHYRRLCDYYDESRNMHKELPKAYWLLRARVITDRMDGLTRPMGQEYNDLWNDRHFSIEEARFAPDEALPTLECFIPSWMGGKAGVFGQPWRQVAALGGHSQTPPLGLPGSPPCLSSWLTLPISEVKAAPERGCQPCRGRECIPGGLS